VQTDIYLDKDRQGTDGKGGMGKEAEKDRQRDKDKQIEHINAIDNATARSETDGSGKERKREQGSERPGNQLSIGRKIASRAELAVGRRRKSVGEELVAVLVGRRTRFASRAELVVVHRSFVGEGLVAVLVVRRRKFAGEELVLFVHKNFVEEGLE
jgi:hypothetical protein